MKRLLLLIAIAQCAHCATCPSNPAQGLASFSVTAATVGTSPPAIGVNAGHNYDPSWVAWLQRLGVTGLRVFGLAGGFGTLEGFATAGLSSQDYKATWGNDLTNAPVTNQVRWTDVRTRVRICNS